MIIYWDVTKTGFSKIKSGINRVSSRLMHSVTEELKGAVIPVVWNSRKCDFETLDKPKRLIGRADDLSCFLTVEVFSEEERPGFTAWLKRFRGMTSIVFHDAIPLQYPEFTWPHSVTRHPHYMKMLLYFDNVYGVSNYSLNIVKGYLYWLNAKAMPRCQRVFLGADFSDTPRVMPTMEGKTREIIMTGILETRKNQDLLLDAVEILSEEGIEFEVRFIGRINPHFGKPIAKRIKDMKKAGFPVNYEYSISDEQMRALYERALLSVFPSITEGCGLPVLESVWAGLPVVASDIPPVVENGSGGVLYFVSEDATSLADKLRILLTNEEALKTLYKQAGQQKLLSWSESGKLLVESIKKNMMTRS